MYRFSVYSRIHELNTFDEFAKEFAVNARDLLLVNKYTYHDFPEELAEVLDECPATPPARTWCICSTAWAATPASTLKGCWT